MFWPPSQPNDNRTSEVIQNGQPFIVAGIASMHLAILEKVSLQVRQVILNDGHVTLGLPDCAIVGSKAAGQESTKPSQYDNRRVPR
ncbi:MAG: DUF3956 family protein [Planctomycetaceae bacterium]|nr:DUF3956 family protein [Planctomycetaceae bacterium]